MWDVPVAQNVFKRYSYDVNDIAFTNKSVSSFALYFFGDGGM